MSAFHCATANVHRRANELIHTERVASHCAADDVHNRIYGADLMKVNGLDRNVVNSGFGFAEQFKCANRDLARRIGNISLADDLPNRGKGPPV